MLRRVSEHAEKNMQSKHFFGLSCHRQATNTTKNVQKLNLPPNRNYVNLFNIVNTNLSIIKYQHLIYSLQLRA